MYNIVDRSSLNIPVTTATVQAIDIIIKILEHHGVSLYETELAGQIQVFADCNLFAAQSIHPLLSQLSQY